MLTAAAAILALIPLTRNVFWGPMSAAMMGGLVVATLLTVTFLPALGALVIAFTLNGKLDTQALPPPTSARPELAATFVAPASARELTVAELWRTILLLDRVGTRDNFFDLGGNSLRLALLHHRLQQKFARTFPLVTLFQYPTVATFAAFLDGAAAPATQPVSATDRAAQQREALARMRVLGTTTR